MTGRNLNGKMALLRIYVSDFQKYRHHLLYEYILQQAREGGLAGCTVFRGFWGYGVGGLIHTDIAVEGAGERPILIEITDSEDQVRGFARKVIPWLKEDGGLITEQSVQVHSYQPGQADSGESMRILSKERPMTERTLSGESILLRVYIDESDKYENEPLFEALFKRCRELGIAGCTAIRGIMGFGASNVVHQDHLFRIPRDLPLVIEVVDQPERIRGLLVQIRPMLQGAWVTEEKVQVHHYGAR